MRRALLLAALAAAGCGGDERPAARFTSTDEVGSRQRVEVRFESRGATLAGTLDLPAGEGPHPALVWLHGSGPETRGEVAPRYAELLDSRFAVFAYDKRGAGDSEGTCCPDNFDLLAADAVAAVEAVRSHEDVDDDGVGLLALSQGGWIAPIAATGSDAISFAVMLSGPAVSVGEERLYSNLTGDDACEPSGNPPALISELTMAAKPSLFDPRPYLAQLEIPVLWVYGALDQSQPVEKDLTVLRPLARSGKDFAIAVFPEADHILQPSRTGKCVRRRGARLHPRLGGTVNRWLRDHVP